MYFSKEVGLFPKGLNLAIMEIENNDLRDNVSLICPTNSYLNSNQDLSIKSFLE